MSKAMSLMSAPAGAILLSGTFGGFGLPMGSLTPITETLSTMMTLCSTTSRVQDCGFKVLLLERRIANVRRL